MNAWEQILCIADKSVNFFVSFGVIIALIQLTIFFFDRRNKRKQETIEFYNNLYKEFIISLNQIDEKFPNGQTITVDKVKDDKEMLNAIANYLSCMERFALGMKLKIYHIKVFKKMVGSTLTSKWYDRFKLIIDYFCEIHSNPLLYKVLVDFASGLKKEESTEQHRILSNLLLFLRGRR